jgi:hypothetical protein
MPAFFRDRKALVSAGKELGCGLLTMLAFTAPLWAFTMATRGPRYAFTVLVAAVVVLALMVVVSRVLKKR